MSRLCAKVSTGRQRAHTVPRWPTDEPSGAVRVLVEHPESFARELLVTGLRARGYEVVDCGGPDDHAADAPRSCPVATGEGCPGVDGADVVVSALDLERDGLIVRRIAEDPGGPPIVVQATDWQVQQTFARPDAVPHRYPFDSVDGVVAAIEGLRDAVDPKG